MNCSCNEQARANSKPSRVKKATPTRRLRNQKPGRYNVSLNVSQASMMLTRYLREAMGLR